jgi:hypothetical protein
MFNPKKIIILTNLRGKLKEYKCEIESGKIVFDLRNDRTMIFSSDEKPLYQSNSVEPSVKNMFLKLAEKQVGSKIEIMIWEFSFPEKKFDIEVCTANGQREKTSL